MTGKTIVYLPNWLGDMVMATPFLRSLRASLDGELWGIGKGNAIHIYNGLEVFDRFITLDSKGFIPFLDTISFLRNVHFERGIILPHSFRSALLLYVVGIKKRIGYARNERGFMLTDHVNGGTVPEPTVEHYLKIIDELGGKRLLDSPLLFVTEDEEQKFDDRYMDIHKPYAVFIVGAQYGPSKCWPDSYFSELADLIVKEHNMKVYVLPGKGEEELAHKVFEGITNKDRVEVKLLDIRDLKVCLSRATVVVSNDTGPRHLAAALSVPTVVLLGPMDERYTYYPSDCTYQICRDVPCRPCNKKRCDKDHECLKHITPHDVLMRLEEALENKSEKTA